MHDVIGSLIGIVLIIFLISPIILAVYMLWSSKIDIDNDGQDDLPYRWEDKQAGNLSACPLDKRGPLPPYVRGYPQAYGSYPQTLKICEKYHKAPTRREWIR